MSLDKIIAYLNTYIPLNSKEKEALKTHLTERKIKRRQFILQEDDVCRHYTFVVSGLFKMYAVDKNGVGHNIQFAAENEWIMDIGSFHSEKPSRLYIEAVEPSIIVQINKTGLIDLFSNYHKFNIDFRVIIENKFVGIQNRLLQNLIATAEERYLAFLEHYPHLANRLPNTQIASYIGITPEFLSKLRNASLKK